MHAPASRRVASAATLLPQKSQAGHLPAYDIIADRGPEPRLTLVPFADFCMMHAKVAICHTHTHTQTQTDRGTTSCSTGRAQLPVALTPSPGIEEEEKEERGTNANGR